MAEITKCFTLNTGISPYLRPYARAFFARNNTLNKFSFGDTIPDPFPVGDYPSCPGLLDDAERENRVLKERLRRLRLEEENKRLRREIERLERGAPPTDFKL